MSTIGFAFFESANFGTIAGVMRALMDHPRLVPRFLKGFDYKELTGTIPPFIVPADLPADDAGALGGAAPTSEIGLAELRAARDWARTIAAGSDARPPRDVESLARAALRRTFAELEIGDLHEHVARMARGLQVWLDRYRPARVVIPEDTDYARGRLAAHILRREGIPSVVLHPSYYAMMADYPLVGDRLADHYLVMNESVSRRLLAAGVDPSQIEIVGSALFEGLRERAPRAHSARAHLLYVLQGLPWESRIVRDLFEVGERLDLDVVVKEHPCASSGEVAAIAPWPARARISRDEPLARLLEQADVVVGQSSRVLFEAAVMSIPIVIVDYAAPPPALVLPSAFAGIARDPGELHERIAQVLEGRAAALAPASFAENGGDATRRIVAALERLTAG